MGTYDTIGGSPRSPDEHDILCELCQRFTAECVCPDCPVCGVAGDPRCYLPAVASGDKHPEGDHGMSLNSEQDRSRGAYANYERVRVGTRTTVFRVARSGVHYEVFDGSRIIWERFVKFGRNKANRAGGQAFVEAAREQERIAKEGA